MFALLATCIFAVAEEGDIYNLNEAGYPDRHWALMEPEVVASYEEAGWIRMTGVLWFDKDNHVVEFVDVNVSEIPDLYNKGYYFAMLFNWVHDGPTIGKNMEQSVSVGYWKFNADEAINFHNTYVEPALPELGDPAEFGYYSYWFLDGQSAMEPTGEESDAVKALFQLVRFEYNLYSFGNGEQIALMNGNTVIYSLEEAIASGGLDGELWPLN
jgi:hypothetical protein